MILGVSLVVNELNKGQRMVFRYPESVPQSIDRNGNKGIVKLYEQYFSFSLENLAKLFRPKNALYNKILEVSIDDLCFVSYPCQCQRLSYNDTCSVTDSSGTMAAGSFSALSPIVVGNAQSEEVITMFNVIVTSVSHKAMLKINPDFSYKCQYKFASMPGSDPIAAAIGVTSQNYGLCKQTIRRIVEIVAKALMEEEKGSQYVTEQVGLMLRIMDNWNLTKQLDASAGGAVNMESGNSAAMAANAVVAANDPSTPVTRSNRGGAAGPTVGVPASSLASTPRSSRSNSNAVQPDAAALLSSGAPIVPESAVSLSTSPSPAPAPATTPRGSRANSNASIMHSDSATTANTSHKGSASNSGQVSASATPELNDTEFHRNGVLGMNSGIAKSLSIDTEFIEQSHSLETSPMPSYATCTTNTPAAAHPTTATTATTTTSTASSIIGVAVASTVSGGSLNNSPSPAKAHAHGALTQFHRAEGRSNMSSPNTLPAGDHPSSTSTGSGLSLLSGHGRVNIAVPPAPARSSSTSSSTPVKTVPTPSAGNSGVSGANGSNSFGNLGIGLGSLTNGSSLGDVLGSPTSKDRRSTEWGAHLLTDFMAQSDLANELRILFHNIVGGHSVNIGFNGVKPMQVSLFCKDRNHCEDSAALKLQRPRPGCQQPPTPRPVSSNSLSTVNISMPGSASRQRHSPYARPMGNLNSALSSQRHGKNTKDYAKIKGINLNTQTMLKIADTDTIMNILYSLDTSAFSLGNSVSESSGLNVFPELSQQSELQHNAHHHLRVLTSHRLYTVIDAADPTQSFLDLSLALDEPVEELISMANYLKSWGLVEVIPVIYSRSCYKVHTKSPLNRDSRVGRAFEALLLSFDLQIHTDQSTRLNEDLGLSGGSDNFMPVQDGAFESFVSSENHGSPKRRSSSIVSVENNNMSDLRLSQGNGYNNNNNSSNHSSMHHTGSLSMSHSQSSAHLHGLHGPTNGFSASGSTHNSTSVSGAPAHHLVSPAISKYRQRRESNKYDDLNSLKNSRSSEHFLKNMQSSTNALHGINTSERGGVLTLPAAVASINSTGPAAGPPPTASAPFSGTARNISPVPTNTTSAAAQPKHSTSTIARPTRERGSSFGAAERTSKPSGGFGAAIASFLTQVASHANETISNNRSSKPYYDPDFPGDTFRDVDSLKDSAGVPQSARASRKSRDGSSGAGEVVPNMVASSFPPSSMSLLASSTANKEHGFQHIVSLSEVGGANGIPASLFPGLDPIDYSLYSASGSNKSPFGLLEDAAFEEMHVVHNLDVAENIPLQYSLPALLSAFNSSRVLPEVIELWPEAVRDFSVEIIVFLLRWHVIVPVDSYIVNMLHMFEQSAQAEASFVAEAERRSPVPFAATASNTTNSSTAQPAGKGAQVVPSVSTARVNFALDVSPPPGQGTSPSGYTHGFYRGSGEAKSTPSHAEESYQPLRAQLPADLSHQELVTIERIFPFIVHNAVSTKTISEIVWLVRITEEELVHVIEKIPFLHIVKKIAP